MERLVSEELSLALNRALAREISNGHEVFSVDSNTTPIWLSLIQVLIDSLVVVMEKSPVLHKLDRTILNRPTTLRVLVHDSHLKVLSFISHCDGRVDRVVIVTDLHWGV